MLEKNYFSFSGDKVQWGLRQNYAGAERQIRNLIGIEYLQTDGKAIIYATRKGNKKGKMK